MHDEASFEKGFGGLFFLFLRDLRADGEDGEQSGSAGPPGRRSSWEEKLLGLGFGRDERGGA
ncbi:MAG: hypothetical protein HY901_34310 [Deltaproteobacteria bacterium]|nr:hypothetical protein [Deltaproteobacteria bacterium]